MHTFSMLNSSAVSAALPNSATLSIPALQPFPSYRAVHEWMMETRPAGDFSCYLGRGGAEPYRETFRY